MTITLLLVLWEFLQTKFVSFVVFNLLVNLYFCIFCNLSLGMNQHESYFATSFLWCYHYLVLSIHLKGESGYKSAWIAHQENFNHFTFTFRDNNSQYQDHMDITKCIPSIKISNMSLRDPLEKQVTLASSSFSPKGAVG